MFGAPLVLSPNRVWRTYPGGRTLDELAGLPAPADGHFPEDWIGSVTRAVNIGREQIHEGVSQVEWCGRRAGLDDLVGLHPEYFLGAAHLRRWGKRTMVLVKYLDAALRLHFQVHPTAEFAQARLRQPSGKAEAYYVLGTRPETPGASLHIGFQRPPSRDGLRAAIEAQDTAAMESWFDPIPVQQGDCFFIPGGVPHAIGGGLFLVELMEPSDLAVRFEFERGGLVLPEAARFMGRGLEFCLDVFDLTPRPLGQAGPQRPLPPQPTDAQAGGVREVLINAGVTPCFRLERLRLHGPFELSPESYTVALVTAGAVELVSHAGPVALPRFGRAVLPAELGALTFRPAGSAAEVLLCRAPAP